MRIYRGLISTRAVNGVTTPSRRGSRYGIYAVIMFVVLESAYEYLFGVDQANLRPRGEPLLLQPNLVQSSLRELLRAPPGWGQHRIDYTRIEAEHAKRLPLDLALSCLVCHGGGEIKTLLPPK